MLGKVVILCLLLQASSSKLLSILSQSVDFMIEDDIQKDNNEIRFEDESEVLKEYGKLGTPQMQAEHFNKTRGLDDGFTFCPCKKILVSSLGEAAHTQSQALGVYQYYQEFGGKPSYYGPTNLHKSNRLYFSAQYQGYILGDKLGSNVGFIYVPSTASCPYLITDGWKYYAGRWFDDHTLVVRCIPA